MVDDYIREIFGLVIASIHTSPSDSPMGCESQRITLYKNIFGIRRA